MEIIVIIAVVIIVAAVFILKNSSAKALETLDVNKDGKVDQQDVKEAIQQVKTAVKKPRSQRKNRANGSSTKY